MNEKLRVAIASALCEFNIAYVNNTGEELINAIADRITREFCVRDKGEHYWIEVPTEKPVCKYCEVAKEDEHGS